MNKNDVLYTRLIREIYYYTDFAPYYIGKWIKNNPELDLRTSYDKFIENGYIRNLIYNCITKDYIRFTEKEDREFFLSYKNEDKRIRDFELLIFYSFTRLYNFIKSIEKPIQK